MRQPLVQTLTQKMNSDNVFADITIQPIVNSDLFTEQNSPVLALILLTNFQVDMSSNNMQVRCSIQPS